MKQTIRKQSVSLIEHPLFKPGFAYGFSLPYCVVKLEFTSSLRSKINSIEGIIDVNILRSTCQMTNTQDRFVSFAAKIAVWCLDLQNRCGLVVDRNCFILNSFNSKNGSFRVDLIIPYRFVNPTMEALKILIQVINFLATGNASKEDVNRLISAAEIVIKKFSEIGQNVPDILNAAIDRGISFSRIDGQTYKFGFGAAQKILESTFTSNTSVIGVRLSRNKLITSRLLNQCGFPGGTPIRVTSSGGAVEAAIHLGYPVVVKPMDTDGGVGVSAYLQTSGDVAKAYQLAKDKSTNIIVDRHVDGTGHRFTVMFGKVVKVTAKTPWGIRGDGISTISDLLERDVRQLSTIGALAASSSSQVLDDEAVSLLRQYQLEQESVLPKDCFVPLRRRNNAIAGGTTVLLDFDLVHQDNIDLALRVADLFLLNVAGIDLIIPDVSRSWIDQDCLVCDVNSKPQVGATTAATFLDSVICGTGRVMVSLVLFTGDEPPTRQSNVRDMFRQLQVNSISSSEGVWINGKQIGRPGPNGHATATRMLQHRDVIHAAVVISVEEIMMHGLPCDRIQNIVLVCRNSTINDNSTLQLHTVSSSSIDTVESGLITAGLVLNHLKANSFMNMLWPHFKNL